MIGELPELLSRKQFAEFLTQAGYPIRPSQLAKLAALRRGPPYKRFNRWAVYPPAPGLEWARSEAREPLTSTRDHEVRSAQEQGASVDVAPVVPSMPVPDPPPAPSGLARQRW
jgi:hypothetical protein